MRIGVDFDNTIADYDEVFLLAAKREGLVDGGFVGGKQAVRERIRTLDKGEERWMRLQGRVYGAFMDQARLIDGFTEFLCAARRAGAEIRIISHKTRFGHFDEERVDLRDAARRWMRERGVISVDGVAQDHVFFAATRSEKLTEIGRTGCAVFIDDLEEVFREPEFPSSVQRFLLTRQKGPLPVGPFTAYQSWHAIRDAIFR